MGIGLMAPLFLAGLLAIAIPILVHLMHKERKEPVPFPSLMFLRRVPFRSARRQRIRYWLLFLLRTAALLLIVAAFARPWLSSPGAATAASGGRDIVVLIDRSYSMSARDVWESARSAATEIIRTADTNDRVAVAAFGERPELLARFEDARSTALAAVTALEPGSDVTRYAPAVRLAGSLLAQSRGPAEIVWITDRQQNASRNVEGVDVPANTSVRVIDVRRPVTRNLAVTNVALRSSVFAGRTRVAPVATVFNDTDAPARVSLELRADGRVQQARNVTIASRDSALVEFTPIVGTAAAGEVRINGDDDIVIDDVAHFSIDADARPSVRIQASTTDARFYFENALLAGDTSAFRVARGTARLTNGDLQSADVVVLLESMLPEGAMAERLVEFVEAGGGLIIAGATERAGRALMPVVDAEPRTRRDEPASIAYADLSHPVFAPFRADGTAPFTGTRVLRYMKTSAADGAMVIARFDDNMPALVEKRLGRGRVLYWASGFSRAAGDFVLQPAFVPFVQQLVRYAAEPARVPRTYTVGNVLAVDNFVPADAEAIISTPNRDRIRISRADAPRTLRIDQPGVYQMGWRIRGADARTETVVANVNAAESRMDTLPVSFFEQTVRPRDVSAVSASVAGIVNRDDASRQMIWWYLLAAAFAVLSIETLLGNRISISRQSWR